MDFVVAGFGIGAVLALVGFVLWELFGKSEQPGRVWVARAAVGLMLGALIIWAVTAVSLISAVDDSLGTNLVLLTTLVALVAIAAVTFWYWRVEQTFSAPVRPERHTSHSLDETIATPQTEPVAVGGWGERPEPVGSGELAANVVAPEERPTDFEVEVAVSTIEKTKVHEEYEAIQLLETEPTDQILEMVGPLESEVSDNEVDESDSRPDVISGESDFDEPVVFADGPDDESATNVDTNEQLIEQPSEVPLEEHTLDTNGEDEEEADSIDTPGPELTSDQPTRILPVMDDLPAEDENDADEVSETGAFTSSLLADIDGTSVERGGRYRSSVLADLVANENELEEIGLAKWRPEDRLIAPRSDDVPEADKER